MRRGAPPRRGRAALAAALALAAGLLAGVLWSPIPPQRPSGARPAELARADAAGAALEEIAMRLAALEAALARLDGSGRGAADLAAPRSGPGAGTDGDGAPSAPRPPHEGATAELADGDGAPPPPAAGATAPSSASAEAASLAELRAAVERLERQLAAEAERTRALLRGSSLDPGLLERMRDEARPADWDAWAAVLALWRRSPAEARRAVDLLTAEQVLDRFGRPTDVWSHAPVGTTWQYARDRDPVDGSFGTEIILRLPEGFVTQLVVRGRDW